MIWRTIIKQHKSSSYKLVMPQKCSRRQMWSDFNFSEIYWQGYLGDYRSKPVIKRETNYVDGDFFPIHYYFSEKKKYKNGSNKGKINSILLSWA